MTRKYRNIKGNSQPKRILKYSEEWIQYRKLRGADSVKTEHCDIDDDGHLDSIVRAWRHPALKKQQVCSSTSSTPAQPQPQSGPTSLDADVAVPQSGPTSLGVDVAVPQSGPSNLTGAENIPLPATGPSNITATSVPPPSGSFEVTTTSSPLAGGVWIENNLQGNGSWVFDNSSVSGYYIKIVRILVSGLPTSPGATTYYPPTSHQVWMVTTDYNYNTLDIRGYMTTQARQTLMLSAPLVWSSVLTGYAFQSTSINQTGVQLTDVGNYISSNYQVQVTIN